MVVFVLVPVTVVRVQVQVFTPFFFLQLDCPSVGVPLEVEVVVELVVLSPV